VAGRADWAYVYSRGARVRVTDHAYRLGGRQRVFLLRWCRLGIVSFNRFWNTSPVHRLLPAEPFAVHPRWDGRAPGVRRWLVRNAVSIVPIVRGEVINMHQSARTRPNLLRA